MPPDLGALYSYCSRKTFFIVPNHTSQQPGLPRKWWYTVGIEQLSCALLGSLQASGSLFSAIFFFFCYLYTFYPIGDGFCVAGPWDLTCRWMDTLSPGNLEAMTSSCAATSFCPSGLLHHVWIFFHSPGSDCTQPWIQCKARPIEEKPYLFWRSFATTVGTLLQNTGAMWLSLTFPDSCAGAQNAAKSGQSWPNVFCDRDTFQLSSWGFSGNPSPHLRDFQFSSLSFDPSPGFLERMWQ